MLSAGVHKTHQPEKYARENIDLWQITNIVFIQEKRKGSGEEDVDTNPLQKLKAEQVFYQPGFFASYVK